MVLEDIFKSKWMKHRPYLAFGLGFLFTFIAFGISFLLFKGFLSLATVFITTLFLIPMLMHLIKREEKIDRKYGLKHFFKNHKDVFETYIFSFLGVFFAFFLLGLLFYNTPLHKELFSFQIDFIEFQQGLNVDNIKSSLESGFNPSWNNFQELVAHNLVVVILCFILSFFYSASAIFLIILNGSVFAHFIVLIVKNLSNNFFHGMQAFGAFMLHLIPETTAFLIAAIAGGIASRAVINEKKFSDEFKNVFKDATVLLMIACLLIIFGALIEVFITTKLFDFIF